MASDCGRGLGPSGNQFDRRAFAVAEEFVGVYSPETVRECMEDSYRRLMATATVTAFVPVLAERFTRDRLRASWLVTGGGVRGVLFVCTHNAGRSQIAAGWLRHLRPGLEVWSAGTEPTGEVSDAVVEAMWEVGVDLGESYPKPLTDEIVGAADVVVTMGCGEACPVVAGRRYVDWVLAHAMGDSVEAVRGARDELRERVLDLLASMEGQVV